MCRGTDRSNTSWRLPARGAEPQCGTCARMTSSLKSATTATEYVVPFCSHIKSHKPKYVLFSLNALILYTKLNHSCARVRFLDALLWTRLEPRSGHSAGLSLGGRSDASHPDVGFAFCYLSSQDFRESHTVNRSIPRVFICL